MTRLVAQGAVLSRRRRTLVGPVSLSVPDRSLIALIGPNGAGKTSLLRLLAGTASPTDGAVLLDGRPLHAITPSDRVRRIAYQPQAPAPVWSMTARAVVGTARHARRAPASDDRSVIDAALAATGVLELADRAVTSLSGGELARVLLARTLAMEAPILLLDEPTAAMDLPHQHAALSLLRDRAHAGASVLVTVHDLLLACRHADRLWWMDRGALVADTPPDAGSVRTMVERIYGCAISAADDHAGRLASLRLDQPDRKL